MKHHPDKLWESPAEFKAVTDKPNVVEGYASIFGNVDSYGDVVRPGAFKKTIKERIPKRLVPFVADHRWDVSALLGTVVSAEEDSKGLSFTAELSATPGVQEVRQKMLEGHLHQVSFSFRTISQEFPKDGGEMVDGRIVGRYLTEVVLLDIAPVVLGANERASITQVKAFNDLMRIAEAAALEGDELRMAGARLIKMADEIEAKIWEDTESEIRWRLKDPDLFKSDTFRSKDIGKGIRLILGKLKDPPEGEGDSMVAQAVRFEKEAGWDLAKAKAWAKEHPDFKSMAAEPVNPLTAQALELESQAIAIDAELFINQIGAN